MIRAALVATMVLAAPGLARADIMPPNVKSARESLLVEASVPSDRLLIAGVGRGARRSRLSEGTHGNGGRNA